MLQYAITNRLFCHGDQRGIGHTLLTQAAVLRHLGVDFLQIREKDLPPAELLALARSLRLACPRDSGLRILLNGPADLALAADLDGVHLPGGWIADDLDAIRAAFRQAARPAPFLSVTTHTLPEVRDAHAAAADLILFGPIFEKRLPDGRILPGTGLDTLAAAARAGGDTPLLALGGVTPGSIPSCLAAGAAGVAAIRLFLSGNLPEAFADRDPSPNPEQLTASPAHPSAMRK